MVKDHGATRLTDGSGAVRQPDPSGAPPPGRGRQDRTAHERMTMHRTERRTGGAGNVEQAGALVRRAEWFSVGNLLGIGRRGGWTAALSGALVAAACTPALAGPQGAQVARGDVSITRNGP